MAARRTPVSTYRLQLNASFRFADARALAPYLESLGISDLYVSPIMTARRGSTHGYDVADPTRISEELGGEDEFLRLAAILAAREMGLLLDIVPNHTAASLENPWWRDVLQNGPVSPYAPYFDITWQGARAGLENRVLLPILGAHYGDALEKGELALVYEDGRLAISYYDWRLPVAARSYGRVFGGALPACLASTDADDQVSAAVERAGGDLQRLAVGTTEQFQAAADALWQLYRDHEEVRRCVDEAVRAYAGQPGEARTFDALDQLVGEQTYRLAYWRVASPEINYRRFFDVSDLVAMRVEDERVFAATHAAVLKLVAAGQVTGLRIDHIDGLADPLAYLTRLQQALDLPTPPAPLPLWEGGVPGTAEPAPPVARGEGEGPGTAEPAPSAARREGGVPGTAAPAPPVTRGEEEVAAPPDAAPPFLPREGGLGGLGPFVVVEKILTGDEELPREWPVGGTTGYEFIRAALGLLVDPQANPVLDALWTRCTGQAADFDAVARHQKRRVMAELFAGDVSALATRLSELASRDRLARDLTLGELEKALIEVTAQFPVYRTYTRDFCVAPRDHAYVEQAITAARERQPDITAALAFLRRVLLLETPSYLGEPDRQAWLRYTMRWQQFTGPIAAKGVEDTALYVYTRFLAENEVGSEPATQRGEEAAGAAVDPVEPVAAFHHWNAMRLATWPHTMNATSTHDTKRSEDVRARLAVLSELPEAWAARLERWREWNRPLQPTIGGRPALDGSVELLLYQTLVGAWPLDGGELPSFAERVHDYLVKASREAKQHTSWLHPDEGYERALTGFALALITADTRSAFQADFREFQRRIAFFGAVNGLVQVLLKIAIPGVPDFYQGTELWDFSLVDPDNRRPADFAAHARLLSALDKQAAADRRGLLRELLTRWDDGRIKLLLTAEALRFRRAHAELFAEGAYLPLSATGARREHVCAFARRSGTAWAVVVVPRLSARLAAGAAREAAGVDGADSESAPDALPPLEWPVGTRAWSDTALTLPPDAPPRWRDVISGAESVAASRQSDLPRASALSVGAVLRDFPVALLRGEPD